MISTFINLGNDFTSSTLSLAGLVIADLNPYTVLVVGTLLALIVVAVIIRALIGHR